MSVLSDFILYSLNDFEDKEALIKYKVKDLTLKQLGTLSGIKSLKESQKVGFWTNMVLGNSVNSNVAAYFLVKGGMPVRGIPIPSMGLLEQEDGKIDERDEGYIGVPQTDGEDLVRALLE